MPSEMEGCLEVFRALSNPYRLRILAELCEGPRTITDLSKTMLISTPLVAIHMRNLLKAGLVRRGNREIEKQESSPPINRLYYEATNFNLRINPERIRRCAKR